MKRWIIRMLPMNPPLKYCRKRPNIRGIESPHERHLKKPSTQLAFSVIPALDNHNCLLDSNFNIQYSYIGLLALIVAGLGALLQNETDSEAMQWILFGLGLSGGPALMVLTYLALLPRSAARLYFKVPGVPLIPCLSIVINLFLMFSLSSGTWIRFAVWMAVGKQLTKFIKFLFSSCVEYQ